MSAAPMAAADLFLGRVGYGLERLVPVFDRKTSAAASAPCIGLKAASGGPRFIFSNSISPSLTTPNLFEDEPF